MTNDPFPQRFRELSWRRKLSPAEQAQIQAWLTAHPDVLADWEADTRLTEILVRLPDVPVATNFTARVLQGVAAEEARARRKRRFSLAWLRRIGWAPQTAFALLLLGGGLVYRHHMIVKGRLELANSIEVVSSVVSLPSAEILQDFDAIRALNQEPAADEQLLSLFQ